MQEEHEEKKPLLKQQSQQYDSGKKEKYYNLKSKNLMTRTSTHPLMKNLHNQEWTEPWHSPVKSCTWCLKWKENRKKDTCSLLKEYKNVKNILND